MPPEHSSYTRSNAACFRRSRGCSLGRVTLPFFNWSHGCAKFSNVDTSNMPTLSKHRTNSTSNRTMWILSTVGQTGRDAVQQGSASRAILAVQQAHRGPHTALVAAAWKSRPNRMPQTSMICAAIYVFRSTRQCSSLWGMGGVQLWHGCMRRCQVCLGGSVACRAAEVCITRMSSCRKYRWGLQGCCRIRQP